MDRNEIVWILECCLLSLDGVTKKDLREFGASKETAEIGIQLYFYLKDKKIVQELENGY